MLAVGRSWSDEICMNDLGAMCRKSCINSGQKN